MSAATVIVLGTDYGLTAGLIAWFADRRLTLKRAGTVPGSNAPEQPARPPAATPPHTPAAHAVQRQLAYNFLVNEEGKTPAEAAADLGIIAPRTAWDYERRRAAMLAQDGVPNARGADWSKKSGATDD